MKNGEPLSRARVRTGLDSLTSAVAEQMVVTLKQVLDEEGCNDVATQQQIMQIVFGKALIKVGGDKK